MATTGDMCDVTYEQLAAMEQEFSEVETELIRQQVTLCAPLYERRAALVGQIPNFWPLVFEQAPIEIDTHLNPVDSRLLLSALRNFSVHHFEPEIDPRSVRFRFEFESNEYFSDQVLEKTFWWRTRRDASWTGLVSDAIAIHWKDPEKDLTRGFLDLACAAGFSVAPGSAPPPTGRTPEQTALQAAIDDRGIGGLSFFAWFGYQGPRISDTETAEAMESVKACRQTGKKTEPDETGDDSGVKADRAALEQLEIFPNGDELAVALAEDLWPGAVKYFLQAQEEDDVSDADFVSDNPSDDEVPELCEDVRRVETEEGQDNIQNVNIENSGEAEVEDLEDQRPTKKRRAK